MALFLAALLVFVLVIVGMSVGTIFGDRHIKGSCGGLNATEDEAGNLVCGVCGKSVDESGKPLKSSK